MCLKRKINNQILHESLIKRKVQDFAQMCVTVQFTELLCKVTARLTTDFFHLTTR